MGRNWIYLTPVVIFSLLLGEIQAWHTRPSPPAAPTGSQIPPPFKEQESPEPSARAMSDFQQRFLEHRFREASREIRDLRLDRQELRKILSASDQEKGQLKECVNDLEDTIGQLQRQWMMLETCLRIGSQRNDSEEVWRHLEKGVTFSKRGQSDRAIEEYRQAIALDPSAAQPWENLGLELLRLRDFSKAREALTRALKLNPGNPRVHYNLGVLFDEIFHQPHQALLHYQIFLALVPEDPDAPQVREWAQQLE